MIKSLRRLALNQITEPAISSITMIATTTINSTPLIGSLSEQEANLEIQTNQTQETLITLTPMIRSSRKQVVKLVTIKLVTSSMAMSQTERIPMTGSSRKLAVNKMVNPVTHSITTTNSTPTIKNSKKPEANPMTNPATS